MGVSEYRGPYYTVLTKESRIHIARTQNTVPLIFGNCHMRVEDVRLRKSIHTSSLPLFTVQNEPPKPYSIYSGTYTIEPYYRSLKHPCNTCHLLLRLPVSFRPAVLQAKGGENLTLKLASKHVHVACSLAAPGRRDCTSGRQLAGHRWVLQ